MRSSRPRSRCCDQSVDGHPDRLPACPGRPALHVEPAAFGAVLSPVLQQVLLLEPESEGTAVRAAADIADVRALLEGGLSLSEAVIPRTSPKRVDQLALFPA